MSSMTHGMESNAGVSETQVVSLGWLELGLATLTFSCMAGMELLLHRVAGCGFLFP